MSFVENASGWRLGEGLSHDILIADIWLSILCACGAIDCDTGCK